MAGHSKWANIKHKKARADAQKGRVFTKLAKQIILAAREGGGDLDANFRLRLVVDKAKAANMPNENIERAIAKGSGGLETVNYEEIVYEGYGPGGAAILMELLTDNRNRTASEIRYIFSRHGGNLGESGCVAWMFAKKGLLVVKNEGLPVDEDELLLFALEAGAEDVKEEEDAFEIITSVDSFKQVKETLQEQGINFESAEITMIPQSTVEVQGHDAEKLMKLMEALEDHDDVQEVYANFNIADDVLAKME
ncbi:MAG: YebC/PmpR family DNA-binding transcriptional regulator [bacterium]|jgi:YebC/PmpR family DNA-binding regulatory protein